MIPTSQQIEIPGEIRAVISQYPPRLQSRLLELRELIFDTAREENITEIEESLKWGQPSYKSKNGSTIRFDGKEKTPTYYYLYFHCQSSLIETFKLLYRDELSFEGNRAIRMQLENALPVDALKHCITLALNYHQIKHLPNLGVFLAP